MTTETNTPVKALFIDDDTLMLRAIGRTVRRVENLVCWYCSEPLEAMRTIGAEKIDVVICDYNMPEMSGVELLGLINRLHPHTTRIMMTGQADRRATIAAINEGHVAHFIEKPFDPDLLCRTLEQVVRGIMVQRRLEAESAVQVRLA